MTKVTGFSAANAPADDHKVSGLTSARRLVDAPTRCKKENRTVLTQEFATSKTYTTPVFHIHITPPQRVFAKPKDNDYTNVVTQTDMSILVFVTPKT